MCGRLDQHEKPRVYAAELSAVPTSHVAAFTPRWNLAASQGLLFVAPWKGERRLGVGSFGFGKARSTTASVELLMRSWKALMATGRCVVPVNGWYDWQVRSAFDRTPYHFHARRGGLALLAGLWHRRGGGIEVAIVTRQSDDETVRAVHPRMPMLLRPGEVGTWLQGTVEDALELTTTQRPGVDLHQVGPDVSNWRNQGPDIAWPLPFSERPRSLLPAPRVKPPTTV